MKNHIRITVLMLITSFQIQAQIREIYSNSFEAKNLKTLELDLDGTYVLVEPSEDNKVHFYYTIEFKKYSENEIENYLGKIKTSANIIEDKLEFKTSGSNTSGDVSFSVETLFGITFEGDYISFKEPTTRKFRKGKQYFMDINSSSRGKSLKEYLKNLRGLDGKGGKKKIKEKDLKILKTKFVIKIPPRLNLKVTSVNSSMTFKLDLESQLIVNARDTSLKFQNIANPLNNFDIVNGNFMSNILNGGSYKFNHVANVQVAEVKNLTMDNEFTTTKIGEIGRNVEIVDFNSKFWIHNFSDNFENFTMTTEYSEINLFFPEEIDYYIETFGYDTVHYYAKLTTEIPPSRKKESSKMMIIGDEKNPNKIQINTVHGIVRFGEDFIDFGE